jgi:HupE / UreJ protein
MVAIKLILKLKYYAIGLAFVVVQQIQAHPMPNTMVVLTIHDKYFSGEIFLPLGELQSAIGKGVNDKSDRLVERLGDKIKIYLKEHIKPKTFDGKNWDLVLGEMRLMAAKSKITGDYKELIVSFSMTPPPFYDLRNFYFNYDAIVHQVITHKILVSIKQDWQQGILKETDTFHQIGVIELDIPSGKVLPFQISLAQGSSWQGFKSMVSLGIAHIKEGTDHILFILTLLLPAMLLAEKKRWTIFLGAKNSIFNLLKIVTAFTIGHSFTLLLGSANWLHLPSKQIENFIAITIFISAFHAYRPIYPKREVLLAGTFGLIHGLAFAETLTNLQLSTKQMVLSILGFNIGIELMQIFIILLTFPFLMLWSKNSSYTIFRIIGAVLVGISAIAWMAESIQNKGNYITQQIENVAEKAIWLLFALTVLSVSSYFLKAKTINFSVFSNIKTPKNES